MEIQSDQVFFSRKSFPTNFKISGQKLVAVEISEHSCNVSSIKNFLSVIKFYFNPEIFDDRINFTLAYWVTCNTEIKKYLQSGNINSEKWSQHLLKSIHPNESLSGDVTDA